MKMKHGVVFALIWLGATAPGWAQGLLDASNPRIEIPFEVDHEFGAILIRAQVNGHPATLVVDTGCSHTILSSELLQVRPLALEQAPSPSKGSGLVGRGRWTKATVEVGRIKWVDRKVLVMNDFQEISNSMKQRVDGILGLDVLGEFDLIVLDFKHHRLQLY